MEKKRITEIEIPADAKTVTLGLERRPSGLTLRDLLPLVDDVVELVVEDLFAGSDVDCYRLRAGGGRALLHKLLRSRIVDGESILGLTPRLEVVEPVPQFANGSIVQMAGTGGLRLYVRPPRPDEGEEG